MVIIFKWRSLSSAWFFLIAIVALLFSLLMSNSRVFAQSSTSGNLRSVNSIDCFGRPGSGNFGIVTINRSDSNIAVAITLTNGLPNTTFSVELWEAGLGCFPDNNGDTGTRLTTDSAGNGSAIVYRTLPLPSLGGHTLGDGIGTEQIVIGLDRGLGGDTYATEPISLPGTILISGRVADINGNGVPDVNIQVIPQETGNLIALQTDVGGYYATIVPSAGSYKVTANDLLNDRYNILPTTPQTVTVPPNSTDVDFLAIRRPVILVPGIAASKLYLGSTELWPALHAIPFVNNKSNLSLHPPVTGVYASDVIQDVYNDLVQSLVTEDGYVEYQVNGEPTRRQADCGDGYSTQNQDHPNLFVFAYDWRLSNANAAFLLAEYVKCVQKFYPDTSIDIIAHSMGGLVSRRYILEHSSDHHVKNLITIATPWLGAPKAAYSLETGAFFDGMISIPAELFVIRQHDLKELAEFFPGVHQLLPSKFYFNLGGQPFRESGWDINDNQIKSETYTHEQFVEMLDTVRFPISKPGAENVEFHNVAQDDWRMDSTNVNYYHVYGWKFIADTIKSITALNRPNCLVNLSLIICPVPDRQELTIDFTEGDGTVPLLSASRGGIVDLNDQEAILTPFIGDGNLYEHNGILKNPDVLAYVSSILNSQQLQLATMAADIPVAPAVQPAYYLRVSGSSSISITDELGNRMEPIDDVFYTRVPGVTYYSLSDTSHEMVIETDKVYSITFPTTAEPIAIELTKGTPEQTTMAVRYQDLTLPADVKAILKIAPQGVEDLRYDSDSNGSFETVVVPIVSVTGAAANDTEPPVVTIATTTQQSMIFASITAHDNSAGVKTLYYSVDGRVYQVYTGTLQLNPIQPITLSAFADDNVANRSSLVTTVIRDVISPVSTISLSPSVANGNNGWYRSTVKVIVAATDGSAGVADTRCILDPATLPSTFADLPSGCAYTDAGADVTGDGQHTLYAASRDIADNLETPVSQSFKLDQTNPAIAGVPNPSSNTASWNNTNVTVSFTCNDATSGVATCSPNQTLNSEGVNQSAIGTATDNAGNSASTTISGINIDKTAPDTTLTGQPANPSVTASASFTFIGTDSTGGAGVASFECKLDGGAFAPCTSPQNYTGLAAGSHAFQVRSVDRASNTDTTPASYNWTVNNNTNILIGTCSSYTIYRTPQGQYVAAGWSGTIKVGTNGNETINGGSGPDLMLGLGGNDTLSGQGGDDVLCGGDGFDLVQGFAGNDYLDGGVGSDVLNGGTGDYDQLFAGDGADVLLDGDGVSSAQGGAGNDVFTISLRKGWRNQSNQTRFDGLTAGYSDDTVGLAILDSARFVVNISGDERDTLPSPLEGQHDSLALTAKLDPASQIIKFETRLVVAAADQPVITDESGAEYLRAEEEDSGTQDVANQIFLPLVER